MTYKRSMSMTTTTPPIAYRWTTRYTADLSNNPPINPIDHEVWKATRLSFLDQYELIVSEEGKYRIWRWLDGPSTNPSAFNDRLVVWWERRPIKAPLPRTPGLWPADD